MGKNRIDRLLTQLKDNHTEDIQNAASIFTVAQGAVNQLKEAVLPAETAPALESKKPQQLTKADLIEKYSSYNGCRSAAKKSGIRFSRTPRWSQMVAAFNYLEACQSCVSAYMQEHPCEELKGVSVTMTLGN
ncbi:MAG: hypothetical protein WA947_08590 [Phormidesmis sp.]